MHEMESSVNVSTIEDFGEITLPLPGEVNILERFRNCNLIPSSLSDFQSFVSTLMNDPVSDAVIHGVWKQIYKIDDMNGSRVDDKSMDIGAKCETNHSMNICSEKSQLSNSKSGKDRKVSCQSNSDSILNLPFMKNNISGDVKSNDESSSSDIEVVEVVSLKKVNSDSSGSEPSGSDNESESSASVEILDELIRSKLTESNDEENFCLIHSKNSVYYSNVTQNCECLNCVSRSTQQTFSHMHTCVHAKQTEKLNDGCVKKKKNKKYRKLKAEVKSLKNLLTNLLEKNSAAKMENKDDTTDNLSSLSSVDLTHKVKKKSQKTVKKKGSSETECSKGGQKRTFSKNKHKELKKKESTVAYKKNYSAAFANAGELNSSKRRVKSQATDHTKDHHEFNKPSDRILDLNSPCIDDSKRRRRFLWRDVIVDTLKSCPRKRMPVEELKRKVIAKYYCERGNMSRNTSVKFFKYLHSTFGVVVDADVAIYNDKPKLQVSSKSERKKHVVMKTITTTREYKVT